tara:strand:- start:1118 stop:1330 length:213 start_codon:yes stop_codon:yes gene_type:complete
MKIIYQNTDGSVSVITPASNCSLTDAETALKDVPTGFKFKIVADDFVPSDRTFRNAWSVDEDTLTDGMGE